VLCNVVSFIPYSSRHTNVFECGVKIVQGFMKVIMEIEVFQVFSKQYFVKRLKNSFDFFVPPLNLDLFFSVGK